MTLLISSRPSVKWRISARLGRTNPLNRSHTPSPQDPDLLHLIQSAEDELPFGVVPYCAEDFPFVRPRDTAVRPNHVFPPPANPEPISRETSLGNKAPFLIASSGH